MKIWFHFYSFLQHIRRIIYEYFNNFFFVYVSMWCGFVRYMFDLNLFIARSRVFNHFYILLYSGLDHTYLHNFDECIYTHIAASFHGKILRNWPFPFDVPAYFFFFFAPFLTTGQTRNYTIICIRTVSGVVVTFLHKRKFGLSAANWTFYLNATFFRIARD